jgi:hypothetical protein
LPQSVAEAKATSMSLVEKKKDRAERKKEPKIGSIEVGELDGVDPDWDPTKTSIDWRSMFKLFGSEELCCACTL